MEDLRKRKSKESLRAAFWRVLETKPYNQISISDITRTAGLNRKTFYTNYQNLDELLNDCLERLFRKLYVPIARRKTIGLLTIHASDTSYSDPILAELYVNYCLHSCWGNLIWVLNHSDLPIEDLVEKALSVYRQYLVDYLTLYR